MFMDMSKLSPGQYFIETSDPKLASTWTNYFTLVTWVELTVIILRTLISASIFRMTQDL